MKIYKIEINCLRGIKHLVMDFKGKNAVIYGDNGTGKRFFVARRYFKN